MRFLYRASVIKYFCNDIQALNMLSEKICGKKTIDFLRTKYLKICFSLKA